MLDDVAVPTVAEPDDGPSAPTDVDIRVIEASELDHRCGDVSLGPAPIDLDGFDPATPKVLAAIERVVDRGGGSVVDGVEQWSTVELGGSLSPDIDVVAIGERDVDGASRYSTVSLQRTPDDDVRFVDWNECRATASLEGFSAVEVEQVDVAGNVLVVTGTEVSCASGRSLDGVSIAAHIAPVAGDAVSIALFATSPLGSAQECPGNPSTTWTIPIPDGIEGVSTVLDGSVSPPVPLDHVWRPGENGQTTMILAADPALLELSPVIYRQARSGVLGIGGGGIVFDGPEGEPALLVNHLPGERELAETAATALLAGAGLVDTAVVYEQRDWTVAGQAAMVGVLDQRLAVVLEPGAFLFADTIYGIEISLVGAGNVADQAAAVEQEVIDARAATGFTGPVVMYDGTESRTL